MNIQNINFKKVFLGFLAVFLLFTVVSVAVELSNGGWQDAVTYEQHRLDTNQGRTRFGFGGRHEREGRFGRSSRRESFEQAEVTTDLITSTPRSGNRVLHSVARTYVRISSTEWGVISVLELLLHVAFFVILTLWVYVDSKKREFQPLIWASLTLFFHVFGVITYLIVREIKRRNYQQKIAV